MTKKSALLEKILDRIPGFSGYRKREKIREDDRIIRSYIVSVLENAIKYIEDAQASLVDTNYDKAVALDNLLRRLRLLTDKIRWTPHGYQPHYYIVKIEEADLEKLRSIDAEIIGLAEQLSKIASNIAEKATVGQVPEPKDLVVMNDLIKKIHGFLEERNKILMGLGEK